MTFRQAMLQASSGWTTVLAAAALLSAAGCAVAGDAGGAAAVGARVLALGEADGGNADAAGPDAEGACWFLCAWCEGGRRLRQPLTPLPHAHPGEQA